jgi:hypothetical protein
MLVSRAEFPLKEQQRADDRTSHDGKDGQNELGAKRGEKFHAMT